MPTLLGSLEETIARAESQLGAWWPNPWWPTGNSSFNDCAAFQSWVLWGLNGNQPYQTIVSGVVERSGLEFHAGNHGIQRGDILGYRWTNAVNYDHTEMALGPANAQGFVQSIGANGGGNDRVAVHTRSTGYVHNFARPNYPNTSAAGLGSSVLTESTIMPELIIHISDASGKTVKAGEYYYHRDGVTPIIGPLSGADPTKAGGIYWLNTVTGVPIKDVGGATFEFYQDDQAKRSLVGGTVNVTNPPFDISGLATGAQVAALDAKVTAIHVPTKGTVELS